MRRFLFTFLILASFGFGVVAQKAKIFDVRNGGATSTTIEYPDAASKQAVIDAFVTWAATAAWTRTATRLPDSNSFTGN